MTSRTPFLKKAKLIQHLNSDQKTTVSICLKELNISRRTFFRYIEELRKLGADISYAKISGTYKIENEFDFFKVVLADDF